MIRDLLSGLMGLIAEHSLVEKLREMDLWEVIGFAFLVIMISLSVWRLWLT